MSQALYRFSFLLAHKAMSSPPLFRRPASSSSTSSADHSLATSNSKRNRTVSYPQSSAGPFLTSASELNGQAVDFRPSKYQSTQQRSVAEAQAVPLDLSVVGSRPLPQSSRISISMETYHDPMNERKELTPPPSRSLAPPSPSDSKCALCSCFISFHRG